MYREWPFFKVTIDMIEMVLAKGDPRIAVMYERELVAPELHEFGAQLRALFFLTETKLLEVTGHSNLLEGPAEATGTQSLAELKQKLDLRTPYITPLNIIQAAYLKKLRVLEQGDAAEVDWQPKMPFAQELLELGGGSGVHAAVQDILLIAIKGIAAGMQNTG
jgi:phosphoenolpyruvate carboxylase